MGLSKDLMIALSLYGSMFLRFSAKVFPVTVRQLPSSNPLSNIVFIKGCIPPDAFNSDIKCFPNGFKSAKTGVFLPILVKSSNVIVTPIASAIAII